MKKLLYSFAAVATMLFAAGCAQEKFTGGNDGDLVEVSFNIAMPGEVATKADAFISDGSKATELIFQAFDNSAEKKPLPKLAKVVTVSERKATVKVSLIKGVTYNFVFWAQKPGQYINTIVDGSTNTASVTDLTFTADQLKAMMNNDDYDAFYARVDNLLVTGPFAQDVTLTRPFAQVNVAAYPDDITAAEASNILTDENMTTNYKVKVPASLNLLYGTVKDAAADLVEVEYTSVANPNDDILVGTPAETFHRIAMVYVLANEKKTIDKLDLTIKTKQNDSDITLERSVYNVPIQRNYRTNILGNIFSVDGTFNIVVDNEFATPDNLPEYADIDALNKAFAKATATDADKWSYKVKVLEPGTVTKIVLPNTTNPVDIVLADGAWAEADIEIAYAEGTDVAKPTKLTLAVDELKGLTANITSTHFELVAGSHIETAEVATSNTTFVIQKTASVDNLIINAGGLIIEEGATVGAISVDINADVTLPEALAEKATYFGEVASETALRKAVAEGGEFTIAENIDVKEGAIDVVPGKTLVLDLNKKTISYSGEYMSNGLIWVHRGATATIKNGTITTGDKAYAPVQVTKKGDNADGVATLVVEDITLNGGEAGITGNGSRHNTNITVNNAVISASNGPGIYHPQDGTITIKGENTVITGVETGIEMRAGTLNIEGGKLVSTATEISATPNGNGAAVKGSAVAVAQHTTQKDITVNISGGVFDGPYALYEVNVQQNDPIHVTLNVTGGTFNGQVYSQDCTGFITGGTFAADPSAYVATGYIATLADGKYVVAEGARETPDFSVAPTALNLFVGGTGELVLTNGSDGALTVESDNTEVATVELVEGKYVVTAVAAGSANITFAVAQSNTYEAAEVKVPVTVAAVQDGGITITPVEADALPTSVEADAIFQVKVAANSAAAIKAPVVTPEGAVTIVAGDAGVYTITAGKLTADTDVKITFSADAVEGYTAATKDLEFEVKAYVDPHGKTAEDPLSVAEANEIISGLENKVNSDVEYYVKGTVSSVKGYYNDKYITYYISADGTETNQIQVYNGLNINGEAFSSLNSIMVNDEVVVCGYLYKFNSTNEINKDNKLVSLKRTPAFGATIDSDAQVTAEGGTKTITITGNVAWTVTGDLTATPASGEGPATVEVTVPAAGINAPAAEYTVTVSTAAEVATKSFSFTISRAAGEDAHFNVVLDSDAEVEAKGGTKTLTITSNVAWEIAADDALTLNPSATSGTGNAIITVTVPKNTDTAKGAKYTIHVSTEIDVDKKDFELTITQAKAEVGTKSWTLVTDASTLAAGDVIIITNSDATKSINTTQASNNRIAVDCNLGNLAENVQQITLESGTKTGTFAFNVGGGYLYAASSSSNYMRTQETNNDNGSWTITVSDGVATIKAQGTNSRNWLRYNSSNSLFSCYSSGQADVMIYRYE